MVGQPREKLSLLRGGRQIADESTLGRFCAEHRRKVEPAELILALRLDEETNREVKDYFLLPLNQMGTQLIALTATSRSRFAVYRCPTMDDVLRGIMMKVAASS